MGARSGRRAAGSAATARARPRNVIPVDFVGAAKTRELIRVWQDAERLASMVREDLAEALFRAMDARMMAVARRRRARKRP